MHWRRQPATQLVFLHDLCKQPSTLVFYIALCSYWSDIHFWFAHRLMHPWWHGKKSRTIDPGHFLYKHYHSVHHKSYNPGPWSGLSMHPVEHFFYFTRSLPFFLLPLPHCFFYFINVRAMLGPAAGHTGFGAMGGSYFHYLHHAHLNWNFGTSRVPIHSSLTLSYPNPNYNLAAT